MKSYKVEENPYTYLYYDTTLKCNMNCNMCYNVDPRSTNTYNIDPEYLNEVCKRLPNQVQFRMLGGEPTLHPELDKLIDVINKNDHIVAICTNGLKLIDDKYLEEIKKWKTPGIKHKYYGYGEYPIAWSFDFSGGTTKDDYYEIINNRKCVDFKLKGLKNVVDMGFKSIGINATIIRGLNEEVIPEILEICFHLPEVQTVHFRNMTQVGNWIDTKPYSMSELFNVVSDYIPEIESYKTIRDGISFGDKKCYGCCYRFLIGKKQISIIDFATENSAKCWDRGYLNDKFEIVPFFEYMRGLEE